MFSRSAVFNSIAQPMIILLLVDGGRGFNGESKLCISFLMLGVSGSLVNITHACVSNEWGTVRMAITS